MSWWKIWRNGDEPAREQADPHADTEAQRSGFTLNKPIIRDAERRRLRRLLQRQDDLTYDIAEAETTFYRENRWTERMHQLDDAIAQADADLRALRPDKRPGPPITFPETPIEVLNVRVADPASVSLRVGEVTLGYREELDWSERGHQLALPQLTHSEGSARSLVPPEVPDDEREPVESHIIHSLGILANEALECAVDAESPPSYTLADLGRPCPECGGLLDLRGRCPSCTALEWQHQEVREARERLRAERADVDDDLTRTRERLPILRRQLAETEADIAQLEAKGVEPA